VPLFYRDLACEILYQTYLDLQTKSRKGGENFLIRQDALTFLESDWFITLCLAVNLDPAAAKKKIMKG